MYRNRINFWGQWLWKDYEQSNHPSLINGWEWDWYNVGIAIGAIPDDEALVEMDDWADYDPISYITGYYPER